MIKQTQYLKDAVSVKSYIDFSGDNYEEIPVTDLKVGKLTEDITTQLIELSNKTKNCNNENISVIIIPKSLPKRIINPDTNDQFPLGVLYIPAVLSKEGKLSPPDFERKAPWFPRDILLPFNLQKTAIGIWKEYPTTPVAQKDYISWESYFEAIQKFYEKIVKVSWDSENINNLLNSENVTLLLDNTVYIIIDQTVDAKPPIRKLYEKLMQKDIPDVPLYRKLLDGDKRNEEIPYPVTSIECMKKHVGQMGGKYPISVSQRESMNHFHALQKGEVLAVSGPPGTGKTTLLQSIVADKLVAHALKKDNPPVIVVTSTNNQAVTNVIDSFAKIPMTGICPELEKRWITKADGFAMYFPSQQSLQSAQKKGYLCTSRKGEYDISEIESEENRETALKLFLDSCSAYFKQTLATSQEIIPKIHDKLKQCIGIENNILNRLQEIQNVIGTSTYLTYQNNLQQEINKLKGEVSSLENDIESKKKQIQSFEKRFEDWQEYYEAIPRYIRLFSHFLKVYRKRLTTRLCMHLNLEENKVLKDIVTFEDIQQYYWLKKEELLEKCDELKTNLREVNTKIGKVESVVFELNRKASNLRDYLYSLKESFSLDILYTSLKKEDERKKELERRKRVIEEVDIKGINELLDMTLRYVAFWLAVHYYEAKWLFEDIGLSEKQQKCCYLNIQEKRFRRMAMLTPCMVMTFFKLPSVFETDRSKSEEASYLFNYIDLLIVDEAGQVSPEVALPSFALAKQALVVGDEEQIPPVWEVKPDADVTLACEHKLIKNNTEYVQLQESGLNCSESSLMKVATQACRFQKDGYKGLFLCEHRRCYNEIIEFCNKLVYKGRLKPCRGSLLQDKENILSTEFPAMGHLQVDVSKSERRGSSRYNKVEAASIVQWIEQHAAMLLSAYPKKDSIDKIIGIITPFKAQAAAINKLLPSHLKKIRVGTIHTFQGAECPIIILSTVYGSQDGCFFIEKNRSLMNVAVSRAEDFFFVFGSMKCLSTSETDTSGLLRAMTKIRIS